MAVKKIKNNDNITGFFQEASAASKLDHENIVGFFGICRSYNSIICELMEGGQLREYLRSNKYGLTLWDLVNISHDIVKGCEYMERKKFVHRDLAARNCLLTSAISNLRKVIPKNVWSKCEINILAYYYITTYIFQDFFQFRASCCHKRPHYIELENIL